MLTLFVFGSGSCGNCYYLSNGEHALLIDAGVGIRRLKRNVGDYGIKMGHVRGVLITHDHYDHLDTNAVKILTGKAGGYTQMAVGTTLEPFEGIEVEAVPAYNISPDQLAFHPKERGDAGYIITIAGKRIYVSGDTEDNEDVLAIKDIDIAFVCCNKPFTMTVEQCANVVKAIRPEVFIPYHYGGTDIPTDLDALQESLKGVTKVLIRPLE